MGKALFMIDHMKEEYRKSRVPVANAQIVRLTIYENFIAQELDKALHEAESKDKGTAK